MRAAEVTRLILVLILGLLAGSEARRYYTEPAEPSAVVEIATTRAPDTKHTEAPPTNSTIDAGPEAEAEADEEETDPGFDAEAVMYDQPHQMQQALARLRPQVPGKTDLYFLAFGGDGGEDLFRNEAEYAERLMVTRFDSGGHTLSLVNNADTVATRPLATYSNLELALDGIEKVMDPTEDVLVLFLTSHGSEDHVLLVDLDPLPLDQIGADDLAEILAKHGFRWKVVIVSACYSGGFVAPLKSATTMVITASRADRSSFGCGSDSDITYFGKAFFAEGMNQADSFSGAFGIAKTLVDEWETRDDETHSEPQIASTPMIESKLRSWREGIHLGPPLPFVAPQDSFTAKR